MTVLVQATSGSSSDNLTGLAGWAADTMTSLGGPGVGAIVALENLFPPIPSEVVLPLAGFLAGQGQLSVVAVIVWATAGSVAGALVLYALGAVFGRQRLLRVADRLPLISIDDVQRAERWFARRGGQAVLIGRFVPVVRSLISIPAGVERMPLLKFTLYTTIGSALWNSLFVLLGYALGSRWQQIGAYSSYINNAAIGLIGLALVVIVVRRLRTRRPTPQ
jgi:membrane protein DedA with SNARE-associated domain